MTEQVCEISHRLTWSSDLSKDCSEWTAACKLLARVDTVLFRFLYLHNAERAKKNKQTRIKHLQHSFNHDEELKTSVKRAPKKEKFPVVGSDTQKTRETKWFFFSRIFFLFLIQKHLGLFCGRCDKGIIEFITFLVIKSCWMQEEVWKAFKSLWKSCREGFN